MFDNLQRPSLYCTSKKNRRRLDIPIPYELLFYIPLPVIPIPDIPKRKIEISIMVVVFLLAIPIPDIYTTFINNEYYLTEK